MGYMFRNENPNLGAQTTVQELSGSGTGKPVANDFKPTTREILTIPVIAAGAAQSAWIFQAPWKCQVVAIHFNATVAGLSTLDVLRVQADAVVLAAANGGTLISMLAAPIALNGTANTKTAPALSAAAGLPTVLNAGDQLGIFVPAASTGLVGGLLQVEVVQIG